MCQLSPWVIICHDTLPCDIVDKTPPIDDGCTAHLVHLIHSLIRRHPEMSCKMSQFDDIEADVVRRYLWAKDEIHSGDPGELNYSSRRVLGVRKKGFCFQKEWIYF